MKEKKNKKENGREKKRKSGGLAYVFDGAVRGALDAYVGGRGFFRGLSRRIDVCGRPWLLFCGNGGSGAAPLIAKSGLRRDFVYPENGLASEHSMPVWFFAENAVYIDANRAAGTPQRWSALCAALKRRRFMRRRAVDGLLFVIDAEEILQSDETRTAQIAEEFYARADILTSTTGYKAPVYFIFDKCDSIEGFGELFSDKKTVERMPVAGSLIGDGDAGRPPVEVFLSRYKKVCDDLYAQCLLRLIDKDIPEKNRLLCRLTPEFLRAESKLSAFIGDFFKERGAGGPQFRGFFFTSSDIEEGLGQGDSAPFSNRLLSEIIPEAKFRARGASEGTRRHRIEKLCRRLLLAAVWVAAVLGVSVGGLRDALHIRSLQTELSALCENEATLESRYAALEKLRASYFYLRGSVKSPGRMVIRTEPARGKIREAYAAASLRVMVTPTVKYLESSMLRKTERGGELAAQEHQSLYSSLETYLLLTGAKPAKAAADTGRDAEIFERALRNLSGPRYKSLDEKIVKENIRAVINFAEAGEYESPRDMVIIKAVREKLAQAPRAPTVYASTMEALLTPRRAVPMSHIVGRSDILRYGREVSALYTREGWERYVFTAMIGAAKDPFKSDWVMGPVKTETDEKKLLSELVLLYSEDLRARWLDFIRNTYVNLQPDISTLAYDLEKLSSRDSEIGKMLAAVCSLATQPQGAVALPPPSITDIKGQYDGLSNKLRGSAHNLAHDTPDPFTEARVTFGAVDTFLTGGAFEAYRKSLGELSERVKSCGEQGGCAAVFASRGDNPIKLCRYNLGKSYINMPNAAAAAVKRVLEPPLDHAAQVLAKAAAAELEEGWREEVINYYNERLAGRYPIDKSGPDAPWSDFEEFFKPQSGVLWKFIDKNLSGVMERTPRRWAGAAAPLSIPVSANDEIIRAVNHAERIANNFFKSDGAVRRQDITFHPFNSSSGGVEVLIGDKRLDFRGGLPVTVNRKQASGGETVILRLVSADRPQEELRFTGDWGLMRFFDAGAVERLNNGGYKIRWRLTVQNIYTSHVTAVVQSGTEAMFEKSVTEGFGLPKKILKN